MNATTNLGAEVGAAWTALCDKRNCLRIVLSRPEATMREVDLVVNWYITASLHYKRKSDALNAAAAQRAPNGWTHVEA